MIMMQRNLLLSTILRLDWMDKIKKVQYLYSLVEDDSVREIFNFSEFENTLICFNKARSVGCCELANFCNLKVFKFCWA